MSNQSSSPQGSSRQEDQDIQELSRQRGGAAGTPSSEADENPVLVASGSKEIQGLQAYSVERLSKSLLHSTPVIDH